MAQQSWNALQHVRDMIDKRHSSSSSSSLSSTASSSVNSFQFSPWRDRSTTNNSSCMSSADELLSASARILPTLRSPAQSQLEHNPHETSEHDYYAGIDADDEEEDGYHEDAFSPCSFVMATIQEDHPVLQETSSEDFFSDSSSNGMKKHKRTLGELINFNSDSYSQEESVGLLRSRSSKNDPSGGIKLWLRRSTSEKRAPQRYYSRTTQENPKSLLVQALCGGKNSSSTLCSVPTSVSTIKEMPRTLNSSSPRLQRSNATTRRRCSAPSPLRNCDSSSMSQNISPTVRSPSVKRLPLHPIPTPNGHREFLTKSKSVGAKTHANDNSLKLQGNPGRKSFSGHSYQKWPSGRRSFSGTSSLNSLTGNSMLTAMDRYQQHKTITDQHQRRSSYLPYKSGLLSLFFPVTFFCRNSHHHHTVL